VLISWGVADAVPGAVVVVDADADERTPLAALPPSATTPPRATSLTRRVVVVRVK
jgi:hypothetical protein